MASDSANGVLDFEVPVAGLMLNMKQWTSLEKRMREAEHMYPDMMSGPPGRREFKGRMLFKKLRRDQSMPEPAMALMHLLTIVDEMHCPIFHGAVDRVGLQRAQERPRTPQELRERTALDWAFHDCMKAAQSFMSTVLPGEDTLWIHDHAGSHEEPLRIAHGMFSESRGRSFASTMTIYRACSTLRLRRVPSSTRSTSGTLSYRASSSSPTCAPA